MSAAALKLTHNVEPDVFGNVSLALDEEPDISLYVSTAESDHQHYKFMGNYPASDEMFWIKQHQKQAGTIAKVLTLPFFEGNLVDANGVAV